MSPLENPKLPAANPGKAAAIDLAGLTLLWLLALAIINPFGNFPLNDDWSYGLTVKRLIDTGNYFPTGWESMTLITNVLWGRIFCLPTGFSFDALRCSTLVAAWLGMAGVYWLMTVIRQPRPVARLVALVLAFNPLYFALSNTFMTDVLYLTLTIFAAVFFVKNLREDSKASLIWGTVISVAAILSRQVGLALPLAFAIAVVFQRGFKGRAILRAVTPLAVGTVVLLVFQHWLSSTGRLSNLSKENNDKLAEAIKNPGHLAMIFSHNLFICLMYLGLFLSPILFYKFTDFGLWSKKKLTVLLFIAIGLAVTVNLNGIYEHIYAMPLAGNMLIKSGIGPLTLFDTTFLGGTVMEIPKFFWVMVTIISCAGAAILIHRIASGMAGWWPRLRSGKLEWHESSSLFLLLVPVIYLTLFVGTFFDRYLVPIIPLAAAGLILCRPPANASRQPVANIATMLMVVGLFFFSVGSMRDYLEWNRVRWAALNDLMEKSKIPAADLDGGFEFNGYYSPLYQYKLGKDDRMTEQSGQKLTYSWDLTVPYAMSFNRVNDYEVLHEYHYAHWLPPYTGTIYLLKNNSTGSAATGK